MYRRKTTEWDNIKKDYITTDISYRKLSAKYGVSTTSISVRARKEGWAQARERFLNDSFSKVLEEEIENKAQRMKRILCVSDKLLAAIERAADAFLSEELALDRGALKQLTGAVKDIRDIQLSGSDESQDTGMTVVFGDDTEDYSK